MPKVTTNTATNATVKVVASLGTAQLRLEASAKALLSAQSSFERAQEMLYKAEEEHERATSALIAEVNTVRQRTKITSMSLK